MRNKRSQTVATVSIFFAVMLVIHVLSLALFNILPLPIKPTLVHIPVIVASILYGPKIGMSLGALMGIMSVITNTLIYNPVSSMLFSPFVENGTFSSLIIAMVPRILIGLTPYLVYKLIHNKIGIVLAGVLGSLTNTVFVLGGIFILFADVYQKLYGENIQSMIGLILGSNSLAEMAIAGLVVTAAVPRLSKLK